MHGRLGRFIFALAALIAAPEAGAQAPGTVEKLYVLDCGQGRSTDMSRWTPGENQNVAFDIRDNCYLIKHPTRGWMMWDTGVPEAVAAMPNGLVGGGGTSVWRRPKTIAAQLGEIGIKADDVGLVAVSHTHGDHVGNVTMFAKATLLIQKAEWDWAFAPTKSFPFPADVKSQKLGGDHDVFGDGSVRLLSTPGHTPGHQVAVVRLKNTGVLVLSGDAVHFKDNWEKRRVPSMNSSKEQPLAPLDRIAAVMKEQNAELWINHDKAQGDAAKRPPAFYD